MELYEKLWFASTKLDINTKLHILNEGISLSKLYNYTYEDFFKIGISFKDFEKLQKAKDEKYIHDTIKYLEKESIKYIFINDKLYPARLKNIYKPPIGLFLKGNHVSFENSISIVGARRCSLYGKTVAKSLAKDISLNGICVISGIALGVDTYAHIGAIEGSGITCGVIGSGLKYTYPNTNKSLYEKILEKGCIISEYFPDEPPLKHRFPERNRIISGLSNGVLIVEAGEKSGSLITASLGLDQGKEIYAIPGNITSPVSIGCNKLIKDGAKVVLDVNDILEDYNLSNIKSSFKKDFSKDETIVISCLEENNKTFEQICKSCNIPTNKILSILTKLECSNIVKKVCGNQYAIC